MLSFNKTINYLLNIWYYDMTGERQELDFSMGDVNLSSPERYLCQQWNRQYIVAPTQHSNNDVLGLSYLGVRLHNFSWRCYNGILHCGASHFLTLVTLEDFSTHISCVCKEQIMLHSSMDYLVHLTYKIKWQVDLIQFPLIIQTWQS